MASGEICGWVAGAVVPGSGDVAEITTLSGGSTQSEELDVAAFDQTTPEFLDLFCVLAGYDGGGIQLQLPIFSPGEESTGNHYWEASIRRVNTGEDFQASFTYTTNAQSGNGSAPGTGHTVITINFSDGTQMDSLANGEPFIVRLNRDADNASDNMSGDAQLAVRWIRIVEQ